MAVQCVLCNYTVIRNFAKTIALLGRVVRAAQIPPPLPPSMPRARHSGMYTLVQRPRACAQANDLMVEASDSKAGPPPPPH